MKLSDFTFNLPEELIAKYPKDQRTDSRLLVVSDISKKQNPDDSVNSHSLPYAPRLAPKGTYHGVHDNLSVSGSRGKCPWVQAAGSSGEGVNCRSNLEHRYFKDLKELELLNSGDLLVLNNTKVIPARFYGKKPTGAKIEFLLERVLDERQALVHIKANRAPKVGSKICLISKQSTHDLQETLDVITEITIVDKKDRLYIVELTADIDGEKNLSWFDLLDHIGELPLPPYMNRRAGEGDTERYQTVFAEKLGAVAAPTAGLHFDQELLETLTKRGVIIKYVTLHVGSGTFAPVRVDDIRDHKMHSEVYSVTQDLIDSVIKVKKSNNNKLVAVGTTSLRCLESLAKEAITQSDNSEGFDIDMLNRVSKSADTDIFIYPGYKFNLVDSLITNFHLPGSTLMMLVSAFAGMDEIKYAYQNAIDNKYRFFSYGDSMWLNRKV